MSPDGEPRIGLVETSYHGVSGGVCVPGVETCRGALRNSTASRLPCSRGAGNRRLTERSEPVRRGSPEVGELALEERLRGLVVCGFCRYSVVLEEW